jgi:F-box protein 11
MPDNPAALRAQLDEAETHLCLIRERMGEYVLAEDIPLQLRKNERRLVGHIASLRARLQADNHDNAGQPAPRQPRTLEVDPLRGEFASIGAAIATAQAGDRILVRPGIYREALLLDRPLEIVGEGQPGDVVVEAVGQSVLRFAASAGRVANLTLRQADARHPEGAFGIDIGQGRLEMDGCEMTSHSLACVWVHDHADPRLRRCRIADGSDAGVFCSDHGCGTLEHCDISGHGGAGVLIESSANPTLRRCHIHGNHGHGISIYDGGQGSIEDTTIAHNTFAGVQSEAGCAPYLRRNRVYANGQRPGIVVRGEGAMLERNIHGAAARSAITARHGRPA